MALKRQHDMMAMFSMASMTDVIFLLLIFFMVTSTFVFPNALEVNLPQSSQQTAIKPGMRVYIDKNGRCFTSVGSESPVPVDDTEELRARMVLEHEQNPDGYIALYADEAVTYGQIVQVLDLGKSNQLKIVLATKPASPSRR